MPRRFRSILITIALSGIITVVTTASAEASPRPSGGAAYGNSIDPTLTDDANALLPDPTGDANERMVFPSFFPGNLSGSWVGGKLVLNEAITVLAVERLITEVSGRASGCPESAMLAGHLRRMVVGSSAAVG